MRLLACRLAAAFTLAALLACSGLGVCWKQFARMTHHCCPGGGGEDTAQVKACASVVAHEAAVVVPPPPAAVPVTLDPVARRDVPLPIDPTFPAKGPPLILRI